MQNTLGVLITPGDIKEIQIDPSNIGNAIGAEAPWPEPLHEFGNERRICIWMDDAPSDEQPANVLFDGDPIFGDVVLAVSQAGEIQVPSDNEKAKMLELAQTLVEQRPSTADVANFKRRAGVQMLDESGKTLANEPLFDDEGKRR